MTAVLRDTGTVFLRESLPSLRSPWGLVFGMLQPLVFLLLFGPLLSGVPGLPSESGWQWFVPAILIMLALFGTTGTGYMLLTEMQTGSHERMLVTPMNRSAMLVGRSLKDVTELLVQGVLICAVMVPFGFRIYPAGAVAGFLLLAVVGVAMGALSYALAIACRRHQEMFYMVQQSVLFPLLFLSGMMLPLDMGPGWMQAAGRLNPLTPIVEAMRALFAGRVADAVVMRGWLVAVVIAFIGVALGTRGMRHSNT